MEDLQALDSCCLRGPPRLPQELCSVLTPLNWWEWDKFLRQHPDQHFRNYIVNGIRHGFRLDINRTSPLQPSSRLNMPSEEEYPQVISEHLASESREGRVMGPLDPGQFPYVHRSKFGVVPKSTPGKWRLIVDLSSLERKSVNNSVSVPWCSLTCTCGRCRPRSGSYG